MAIATRMLIPVCSYTDGLLAAIQKEATKTLPEVDFVCLDNFSMGTQPEVINLSDRDKRVLENAEIVIGDAPFLSKYLQLFQNAKWIHSTYAGVDPIVSNIALSPSVTLTRHVGTVYGQQIGEYVLAQILARERNLFSINTDMQQLRWQWQWQNKVPRTLPSLCIGILGVGCIGKIIAKICKAMDMTVWGLTRTNGKGELAFLDRCCHLSELPQLLESCDYVCNVLPSTPQTKGLLDGDILKHCANKKSLFINVGRGSILSENTLVRAMSEGWLGGAILDVFNTEPLPTDSVLWRTPSVTLTPHMSASGDASEIASLFMHNLHLYLSRKPLQYVVDISRGY